MRGLGNPRLARELHIQRNVLGCSATLAASTLRIAGFFAILTQVRQAGLVRITKLEQITGTNYRQGEEGSSLLNGVY